MSHWITVTTPDGDFNAYVDFPTEPMAPVVVVLQEIFGINEDMKATCAELAEAGFISVCPDLFWRQEAGLSLSHWSDEEWRKGLSLYAAFDFDKGVQDVGDTIALARHMPRSSGKVGVMGYCLGGLMTFLTTARVGADASVAYYGGGTENHLEEAQNVRTPLMMHLGEEDEFISHEAQSRIRTSLGSNSNVAIHSYPGCSHAFARHAGTHYDPSAAALANGRTSGSWIAFCAEARSTGGLLTRRSLDIASA